MPNHFHFLVKQLEKNGIIRFISNLQNSYAKYYNLKNNRNGTLFQNQFKGKWIESDEQFLYASRYIHLNPVSAFLVTFNQLEQYPWTSYPQYANTNTKSFIQTDPILNMFSSGEKYKNFVADQANYHKNLSLIKNVMFEE